MSKEELVQHFIDGKAVEPDDLEDPTTPSPILPRRGNKLVKTTVPKPKPVENNPGNPL